MFYLTLACEPKIFPGDLYKILSVGYMAFYRLAALVFPHSSKIVDTPLMTTQFEEISVHIKINSNFFSYLVLISWSFSQLFSMLFYYIYYIY